MQSDTEKQLGPALVPHGYAPAKIWLIFPYDGGAPVLWTEPCPFPVDGGTMIEYTATEGQ